VGTRLGIAEIGELRPPSLTPPASRTPIFTGHHPPMSRLVIPEEAAEKSPGQGSINLVCPACACLRPRGTAPMAGSSGQGDHQPEDSVSRAQENPPTGSGIDGALLSCVELVEKITDYFEGALSAEEVKRIEDHLPVCDGCTGYVDQLRTVIRTSAWIDGPQRRDEADAAVLEIFRAWTRTGLPR
jgi:hypothetical protein